MARKEHTRICSGSKVLDRLAGGGIPKGMDILLYGEISTAKSAFCRRFIAEGLKHGEPCIYVALDEDPVRVRENISALLGRNVSEYEKRNLFRIVDAYSWVADLPNPERFAVKGRLTTDKIDALVDDASAEIGQDLGARKGGRRAVDSLTSLMSTFSMPTVQTFVSRIARSSSELGGVTTLFVLEKGTIDEMAVNNIRYLLDGEFELAKLGRSLKTRIRNMKWIDTEITAWKKFD